MILAFPITRTSIAAEDNKQVEQVRAVPPVVVDDESQLGPGEFLIYEGTKGEVDDLELLGGLSKGFSFDRRIRRTVGEGKTTTRKL